MPSSSPSAPDSGAPAARPPDFAWPEEVDWDLAAAPVAAPLPPRPVALVEVPGGGEASGQGRAAGKGLHGNRIPLERKSGDQLKQFTRFVSRPEAVVTAPLDRAVEGVTAVTPEALQKRHPGEQAVYSVNRLQTVIDDVWTHSELRWLDQLGKVRGVAMGLAFVMALSLLVVYFSKEVGRQKAPAAVAAAVVEALPADEVRQAAMRRAFATFLEAVGTEGKLPWVLESQRVESRMKDFYEVRGEKDPAVASFEVGLPVRAAGEWWFNLACVGPDGGRFRVVAKETRAGGQVDWENFVGYGSVSWGQFLATRPTAPQSLRVQMRPSARYGGKFGAQEWAAYEISPRSGGEAVLGYAPRASRVGQLLAALPAGEEWQPAHLYLRWEPEAGAPGGVVIADWIRNMWLDLGQVSGQVSGQVLGEPRAGEAAPTGAPP